MELQSLLIIGIRAIWLILNKEYFNFITGDLTNKEEFENLNSIKSFLYKNPNWNLQDYDYHN